MVFISSWQEYQEAAEALYAKAPNKARYCVKWKASEGKLVLKITDDTTCLKYKTQSSIYLNRFEALNLTLMQKMRGASIRAVSPGVGTMKVETEERAEIPSPISAAVGGGGVKKKKGKKKK
ncbi:hypothetical protein EW145_g4176 [Phellinidium pouzarii]|uniref:SRP9 domain-containing protein n=1 Tax=Phellinidium pouzarii TaxID=167371 RepID=A0A4S4L4F1_9AGAM|nr:hypothetical protein EW145_g4176 [Phellinidium pouzarii]